MSKIYLGKYVNTHGIKGEIRIKSSFEYKDRVFKVGNTLIINNVEYKIMSYRVHKDYDMVTLENILSIDAIPFPKNTPVYIEREKYLKKDEYLIRDLIGFIAYNSKFEDEIRNILYISEKKKILECSNRLIPIELIENVDLDNKKVQIMEVDGL